MNIDDTIKQMMADEEADADYITPVNYGKLRRLAPQLIYYYIRSHKIQVTKCMCGRNVISKEEADEYLRSVGKLPPNSEGPAEPPAHDGDGEPE